VCRACPRVPKHVSRAVGHKDISVTAKVYAHALGSPQEQAERAALQLLQDLATECCVGRCARVAPMSC
jgi:hypothetical protein